MMSDLFTLRLVEHFLEVVQDYYANARYYVLIYKNRLGKNPHRIYELEQVLFTLTEWLDLLKMKIDHVKQRNKENETIINYANAILEVINEYLAKIDKLLDKLAEIQDTTSSDSPDSHLQPLQ